MERILYLEPLFSNRRERLIDLCARLNMEGKSFLYILPSREAIQDVRFKIFKLNRGMVKSKVIMFDDLEQDIVSGSINWDRVLSTNMQRTFIYRLCSDLRDNLIFYNKVVNKQGFIEEIAQFIKALKRQCIGLHDLKDIQGCISDQVLAKKLQDLCTIYEGYNTWMDENGFYDIDDISAMAIKKVKGTRYFNDIDAMVIDGFTNIDPVNMRLMEGISRQWDMDIYINIPFDNRFIHSFVMEELVDNFKDMGFHIEVKADGSYDVADDIKEVAMLFYSGLSKPSSYSSIHIDRYPCIQSEVRETARDIKNRIMSGAPAYEIALYTKNIDDYGYYIYTIFNEFNIPINFPYRIPLTSISFVRQMLNAINDMEDETKTYEEWMDILDEILTEQGAEIEKIALEGFNKPLDMHQMAAIRGYGLLLKEKESFKGLLSVYKDEKITKGEFTGYFTDLIWGMTVDMDKAASSGVRVIDLDLARGQYYRYVYILGANEGDMPRLPRPIGIFDSQETKLLKNYGINFNNYNWEMYREKIRFNLAMASCREELFISYREANLDDSYVIASTFVEEVKSITGLKEGAKSMGDRFLLNGDMVSTDHELRCMLLKDGFNALYNGLDVYEFSRELSSTTYGDEMLMSIQNGHIEYHRQRENVFNNYEGIIYDDFTQTAIDFSLSASQIDDYMKCPYRFMLQNFMGLCAFEEDPYAYDDGDIGNLYHWVLCRYYTGLKNFETVDGERLENILGFYIENNMREVLLDEGDLEMAKSKLYDGVISVLSNFIDKDLKRLKNYQKTTGRVLRPIILEHRIRNTYVFGYDVVCKVDRVDMEYAISEDEFLPTGRFIIYDYKKSSIKGFSSILENNSYQLAIYYHMVVDRLKNMMPNTPLDCMALLYYGVEEKEKSAASRLDGIYKTKYKKDIGFNRKRSDVSSAAFYGMMDYVKELVGEVFNDVKEGLFYYSPMCKVHSQGYGGIDCAFKDICKYSREKVWSIAKEGGSICHGERFREIQFDR